MRKILIALVGCTALLLASYAGYRGYKVWKRDRMMSMARQFVASSDIRNAALSLQQVLRSDPRNVAAARMMAELMEGSNSRGALLWRTRVVEINPRSVDDRLALARTALTFRDIATATNALVGIDPGAKHTVPYQTVAGSVALALGRVDEAAEHFQEATRLDPADPGPQMNLAVVRLHSTNELDMAEGRIILERIHANPTNGVLRCQAMRELTLDAMRHSKPDVALTLSGQLLHETNSIFSDRLLRLSVLRETKSPDFPSALTEFQREAGSTPAKAAELGVWTMANTSSRETLTWLQALPPATRTNQAVTMVMAESYASLNDWRGLQTLVESQSWGDMDFLRRAFRVRALRGQGLTGAAKGEWELALKVADNQKASMIMLMRVVAIWKWESEVEELLWAIVNRYPEEKWAFQALAKTLYVGGRTRPLMMLYNQQLKREPSDLETKNNVALLACLLEARELKPYDLARDVYEKVPTNVAYASTYAFSLHLQQKDADALKIFQTFKPKDLEDPSMAGYYGLVLKATGNKEKSRIYLDWASKAPMLPEEKRLFDQARSGA
jgi:tetratricopeptide (TPR) repeat protein